MKQRRDKVERAISWVPWHISDSFKLIFLIYPVCDRFLSLINKISLIKMTHNLTFTIRSSVGLYSDILYLVHRIEVIILRFHGVWK